MELLLIRHGQSLANIGQSTEIDCELSDHGHTQAISAAELLRAQDLKDFTGLVSPYQRAIQTARYFTKATGLAFSPDSRLREYGKAATIAGHHFPAETPEELVARITDFVNWAQGKKLAIISHGSPIALLMQFATQGICSTEGNFWECVPNCSLWHVREKVLTDFSAVKNLAGNPDA
jgi:broad specificity phosphatase PhoE